MKRLERNRASAVAVLRDRRGDLAFAEVDRGREQRQQRDPVGPDAPDRRRPAEQRQRVADAHAELRPVAQRARARLHADQLVVLDVLDRVERVVADHPEDAAEPQQQRGQRELARHRGPADQRAPAEHQARARPAATR